MTYSGFQLEGRIALVTGGGGQIGRAVAHALSDAGAAVAVAGRTASTLDKVRDELLAKGREAMSVVADVADESSVDDMVQAVVDRWGGLTIAVNNAGAGGQGAAEDFAFADWRRIMSVNLDGTFLCCRAEARVMIERGYGTIVNIASQAGSVVTRLSEAAYCTSKAGIIHLTRSLAVEWGQRGIRVNSVSPGFVGDVEALMSTDRGRDWVAGLDPLHPMGGLTPVEDLKGAVVYLASSASDSTTGHDLIIDRGYGLW